MGRQGVPGWVWLLLGGGCCGTITACVLVGGIIFILTSKQSSQLPRVSTHRVPSENLVAVEKDRPSKAVVAPIADPVLKADPPVETVLVENLSALYSAYDSNLIDADRRFLNKRIRAAKWQFEAISKDPASGTYRLSVIMHTNEADYSIVTCVLSTLGAEQFSNPSAWEGKNGDYVLEGICLGCIERRQVLPRYEILLKDVSLAQSKMLRSVDRKSD